MTNDEADRRFAEVAAAGVCIHDDVKWACEECVKKDGGHVAVKHARSYGCSYGCMFCDGGLFACEVCHSFEGATTTHCPGRKMTQDEIDAVYDGRLNFRNGEWRSEPSMSCSSHYSLPDADPTR